jgi:hypothetical protein
MTTMTIGKQAGHQVHLNRALRIGLLLLALVAALALAFVMGAVYHDNLDSRAAGSAAAPSVATDTGGAFAGWIDAGAALQRGAAYSMPREKVWRDAGAQDGVR